MQPKQTLQGLQRIFPRECCGPLFLSAAGDNAAILVRAFSVTPAFLPWRPQFTFTEAISLFVDCESQDEVDDLWAKLAVGGEESQCGWLKDKFGLSWQIIPRRLVELLSDPDPEKSGRAMTAMLGMRKIDIPALEDAYRG